MYSQVVSTHIYFHQFSATYLTLFLLSFLKYLECLTRFRTLDPSQIASSSLLDLENTSLIIIL